MVKKILANVNPHEARVALTEDNNLVEIQVEIRGKERLVGNIYKGKVANILPGMQAAFVDIGLDKNAFLYAGDILSGEQDFEFDVDAEGEQIKKKIDLPNIKDILQPGQEIIVQVLKQPGGAKGARVTTHITLPGRLLVLMPTVDHIGISRRIESEAERDRLRGIVERVKPPHVGVILRTAAQNASEQELEEELIFYSRLWEKVCDKGDFLSAPRLLHTEENLLFRTARDLFTEDVDEFIINDKDYFERVLAYVNIISPQMADRVKYYSNRDNMYDTFNIEDKISKALSRKVWLKNGCYLIIDRTEALTAIDVNTGKYIGEDNLQDTILNANIEAAQEIAHQLRLRDISGIIIIDFIDMEEVENKKLVVEKLQEALRHDRTKSNVLGMTELGLVEMTRKKVRRELSTLTQTTCPVCGGSGRVYNLDTMAMQVRREVVRTALDKEHAQYAVEVSPALEEFIVEKNNQNQAILPVYEHARFYIKGVPGMHPEQIKISVVDGKAALNGTQVFC